MSWTFFSDKKSYEPGESCILTFEYKNNEIIPINISNFELNLKYGNKVYNEIKGTILPGQKKVLGHIKLFLPKHYVGKVFFNFNFDVTNYINNRWVNLRKNAIKCPINVIPNNSYNIFVSRGLSNNDRLIGDPIVDIIQKWNINTITVGIEIKVPDNEKISSTVKKEIKNAEALIAIATPRFLDNVTDLWKAMEWYHGEVGIAFGVDKPLLIIKDERVSLGGLPPYLTEEIKIPTIEFNPYNLRDFRLNIN